MADVYLKYVGKKPTAIDSVAGTGLIWQGKGDIKPVPEAAAEKLVKYPDQWKIVSIKEALAAAQSAPAEPPAPVIPPFDDGLAAAKPAASAKAKASK